MGKEQNTNKLSRRDLLKISGIGLLALLGVDQLLGKGEFRQRTEDLLLGAINYKVPEFEDFPSSENCINKGRAFWIVHRGYLAKQGYSTVEENRDHPLYPRYWENTTRLLKYLVLSGEPTFLVVEDRIFQQGYFMTPSNCTSLVVTINMTGSLKRFVHTHVGILEQDVTRTKDFLKASGINTLAFAGEVAHKGFSGTGGCLTGIAKYFMEEFDVKGIEGCVYPLDHLKHSSAIQKELYFDTIPIPTL